MHIIRVRHNVRNESIQSTNPDSISRWATNSSAAIRHSAYRWWAIGGPLLRVSWVYRSWNSFEELDQHVLPRSSVGRCVIPWEFFGKSVKHTFSCRKMYSV